jgi:uncharacterized membrane protein
MSHPSPESVDNLVPPTSSNPRPRRDAVDLLRGAVMVVMVLDHTRDFFTNAKFDPTDLTRTTPALFFTRWVTHFSAPVFMFLAGTGAFLYRANHRSKFELARFLFTRGLWLIFLEWTVEWFGLTFTVPAGTLPAIVLWALGSSMIALSLLVFLPTPVVAVVGLIMIFGHNAFDSVRPDQLGGVGGAVWKILHVGVSGVALSPSWTLFVVYPLVPWIGVMAVGYAFGMVLLLQPEDRSKVTLALGLSAIALFIGLRASNLYGDAARWSIQRTPMFTVMSFLNCGKYPPSLLFLLMTLGPALVALAVFDRWPPGAMARPVITLGRVPLFYFLLQWYILHILAIVVAILMRQPYSFLLKGGPLVPGGPPSEYGYGLPFVYAMWAVVVLLLYPFCAWFADLKRWRRDAWLSYL